MVISAPVHTKKVALGVFSNVVKIACPFRLTVVVNCSRNVAVTVLWKVVMNGPTPVWSVEVVVTASIDTGKLMVSIPPVTP